MSDQARNIDYYLSDAPSTHSRGSGCFQRRALSEEGYMYERFLFYEVRCTRFGFQLSIPNVRSTQKLKWSKKGGFQQWFVFPRLNSTICKGQHAHAISADPGYET